jgi:hypothetical protein
VTTEGCDRLADGPLERIEVTMECRLCKNVFVIIHPTIYDLECVTCSSCREEPDRREET